jgi:hypothetical protein
MRNSKKQDTVLKISDHKRKRVDELEAELDALFQLPLAEFTGARNALAAQLKKSGRSDEAAQVKALAKPSVSAWAVNQLYWDHREEFDQLIALGERFHKAQTSRSAGKVADMREAVQARREALTHLSDLATSLLRDADPNPGQSPAPDTIHRITTTLEGISAYASRSDGPRPGRLSNDVDPPGFESLAGFSPGATKQQSVGGRQSADGRRQTAGDKKQPTGITQSRNNKGRLEEARKAKIAAARVSLQDAKRSLTEAWARVRNLEAAQKSADAKAKKAEKQLREAEQELRKAKAASEDAAQRSRSITVEVEEAANEVEEAERTVEATSKELDSL